MKDLNKKGIEGGSAWVVAALILAMIALAVILFGSGRIFGGFSEQTTAGLVEQKLEACKNKGERGQLDGTPYPDKDLDGLPDYCDNCPYTPNFGDEVEDKDGDGFPFPKDPAKVCCLKYNGLIKKEEICEDEKNDQVYGPKELISVYLKPEKG